MDLLNIFCLFIVIYLLKAVKISSEPIEIDPKVSSKLHRQTKNQFRLNDISINFAYREENVILDLKLNEHFDHFLSYQKPNGAKVLETISETSKKLCHYQVSMMKGNF